MDLPPDHRKRVKHSNEPGQAHELTFSCFERRPLLTNERWIKLLAHSIEAAMHTQQFDLNSFIVMPEYVHLLVSPRTLAAKVEALLSAIKRPFSYRVKKEMERICDPLLPTLIIRERPGKTSFRFWQEGPGYDRNIDNIADAIVAAEYIHHNPVRRGMCSSPDLYRWSSWRHYHSPATIDVDLPQIQLLRGWRRTLADKPPVAHSGW